MNCEKKTHNLASILLYIFTKGSISGKFLFVTAKQIYDSKETKIDKNATKV